MCSVDDLLNSTLLESVPYHETDSFEEVMQTTGSRVPSELMLSATSSLLQSDFFSSDEEGGEPDRRELDPSNALQLKELIGRGAFGNVYKATWKGLPAAVKVRPAFDSTCNHAKRNVLAGITHELQASQTLIADSANDKEVAMSKYSKRVAAEYV